MKKINPIIVFASTFMAISVTLLDFDDLSWENNMKSYMGLSFFLPLILIYFLKLKNAKD